MLRGIRTASANWLGKLVMGVVVGILALSFAIWGIGDIFRGFGRSAVASVGSTEITVEQFRQAYNERLQQIGTRLGRPITPAMARELRLDEQILGQLISEVALDEWARRIGLGITDDEVARLIRTIPAFHGPNGEFDHALFLARIRDSGYTEPRFVAEQRRVMIRQHLTDSIGGVTVVPKTYLDAVNSYQNEQRSIEFVTLGAAQAGDVPQPTDAQIASYFEERKALFRAPEYRSIVLLRLTPDDVIKWVQVTDEDARKHYEARRVRYTVPGRRHLMQMFFINPDDAKAASDRIAAGTPFATVAKERGLSEQTYDLGFVEQSEFSGPGRDRQVAEAAFSLAAGATSPPIKTRLGTFLIHVVKIEPDRTKPFEEVVKEIKLEMARDRTRAEITEKHDKIEDERAGGATLTEAAQKVGLTPVVLEAVDRSGRDPGNAQVTGLPTEADVLAPAFATGVGVEADAVRLDSGGYIWFEVTKITPPRDRTLEEVKDRVAARWRDDQIAERLKAKATTILDKLKTGAALAEVAAAESLKVETATDLKRSAQSADVPPAAVATAFRTAKGVAAAAEGRTQTERVILRVADVSVPPLDLASPEGRRMEANLRAGLSEDLLRQYVLYIEREIGTKINIDAMRRVAGGEAL